MELLPLWIWLAGIPLTAFALYVWWPETFVGEDAGLWPAISIFWPLAVVLGGLVALCDRVTASAKARVEAREKRAAELKEANEAFERIRRAAEEELKNVQGN